MPLRDVLAALLAVAAMGLAFVAIKAGVTHMPPLLLTAFRFIFAAFPAVLFVPPPAVPFRVVAGYGIALGVMLFGLMLVAVKIGMPAGLASIVVQTQVFFTIGAVWLVDGERPTRYQLAGAALAFTGMVIIGLSRAAGAEAVPFLMVVGAAGAWAVANVIGKRAGTADRLGLVVWGSLAAPVPLLALSLIFEGPEAMIAALSPPAWQAVASIAFMAYPATVMAFSIWNALLSRHPAPVVAPFALLIPVFGLLGTHVVFGERLGGLEILASGLILVGLLVGLRSPIPLAADRASR